MPRTSAVLTARRKGGTLESTWVVSWSSWNAFATFAW